MQRLYYSGLMETDKVIYLKEEYHYILNVLRLKKGDKIKIFNNFNGEFLATIKKITKNEIEILVGINTRPLENNKRLNLYFPIIKPDKLFSSIDSAVQLGVTDFTPILTKYSQINKINYDRINKRIKEAVEQSNRIDLPKCHPIVKLSSIFENNIGKIIWAFEKEGSNKISDIRNLKEYENILIGPEGGFESSEIEYLKLSEHVISVSLSKNILRAETAIITAISQYKLLI